MPRQIVIVETDDGQIAVSAQGQWPKITEILGVLELGKAILLSKQMQPAEQSSIIPVRASKFKVV